MARPGLEPGTPRFSVVPPYVQVPQVCSRFCDSSPVLRSPRFLAFCALFADVTADGGVRRPFRPAPDGESRIDRVAVSGLGLLRAIETCEVSERRAGAAS